MNFENQRYMTRGIRDKVPLLMQIFLWQCIDGINGPRDRLQVFECSVDDGRLKITHIQEDPEYKREYQFVTDAPIFVGKIYVIDDGEHSTMLLAEEY